MPYDQAHRPFPYDLMQRAKPSPRRLAALQLIRRQFPAALDTRSALAPLLDLIERDVLSIEEHGRHHFVITTRAANWSEERHRDDALNAVRPLHKLSVL
jgi:hypothetical protein